MTTIRGKSRKPGAGQSVRLMETTRLINALESVTRPGALIEQGLVDDDKLWDRLTKSSEKELNTLFSELGIDKERLLQTITPLVLCVADKYGPTWFERHWFDLLRAAAVALMLTIFAFMARRVLFGHVDVEVTAATGLRPFEPIRPVD